MSRTPDLARKAQREAARLQGEKVYIPPKPCRFGHRLRQVSTDNCIECGREATKAYGKRNPDKKLLWDRISNERNPEPRRRARVAWKKRNPDETAADTRQRSRLRKLDNPAATPPWADVKAIRAIYLEAVRRSRLEGILYVVDHIVPLKGLNVCGLHVENNLQIITKPANDQKWRY